MKAKEWIPIFLTQRSVTITFWNIYGAIALGVVGFIWQFSGKCANDTKILAIAWVVFAVSNLFPIYKTQKSVMAIHEKLGEYKAIFPASPLAGVVICHLILDSLILWYITKH